MDDGGEVDLRSSFKDSSGISSSISILADRSQEVPRPVDGLDAQSTESEKREIKGDNFYSLYSLRGGDSFVILKRTKKIHLLKKLFVSGK